MDTDLIALISRWAHVGTAIVLVGGTAFFRLAVIPVLEGNSVELLERIRQRWKKFVHAGIAIFLISGFYNYIKAMQFHKGDGLYHGMIGTKILLALFVFFLASVLVGNKPGTQKFRDNAKKWMAVMLMVSAIIVAISGFVKVRGVPATAASTATVDMAE